MTKSSRYLTLLSDADDEILVAWNRYDIPERSTKQLLAVVSDTTGFDGHRICAALRRVGNISRIGELDG